jgi:hypothetical protein
MTIPIKKPCPCGYVSPTTGKPCSSVVLSTLPVTPMSEAEADEIIETYKDAERMRFLLANPAVCATLQFQPAAKRRAWIDHQMNKPKRKKS